METAEGIGWVADIKRADEPSKARPVSVKNWELQVTGSKESALKLGAEYAGTEGAAVLRAQIADSIS